MPPKKKTTSNSIQPINFYNLASVKKFAQSSHNPHYEQHHISLPMRSVVVAGSGGGKTTFLLNFIRTMANTFNHIYIWTKATEPLYDWLTEQIPSDLLTIIYDDLPSLSTVEWFGQSLAIFDDQVTTKTQKPIEEIYIRGRKIKGGVSCMYLTQSYFQVPKIIRLQCNYVFLRKIGSKRDISLIVSEYGLTADQDQMKRMYQFCTNGSLEEFMTIDLQGGEPYTYRKNFDQLLNPDDF